VGVYDQIKGALFFCAILAPIYFALNLAVFHWLLERRFQRSGALKRILNLLSQVLIGILIGTLLVLLVVAPLIAIGAYSGGFSFAGDIASRTDSPAIYSVGEFILLMAILSLAEELLFRGTLILLPTFLLGLLIRTVIGREALKHAGILFALLANSILLSSIIFSVAHSRNPKVSSLALINIFLVGALLGTIFFFRASLIIVWFAHFSWNFTLELLNLPISGYSFATSFHLASLKAVGPTLLTGGSFGPEGSLATTIVFLVAIFCTLLIVRKRISGSRVFGAGRT